MDIDIEEPQKRSQVLRARESGFIIVLHRFLLLYLTLHNLIIPLILNSYNGINLLSDVHYWFLFQYHLHYMLLKHPKSHWIANMMAAGVFGSLTRLLIESFVASKMSMSWGIFSIYLSEFSTLIFYAFYFNKKDLALSEVIRLKFFLSFTILTISSQFIFNQIEIRGQLNLNKTYSWDISAKRNWSQFGCLGSIADFTISKGMNYPKVSKSYISKCGFTELVSSFDPENGLEIVNQSEHTVYISLYHIKEHSGSYKWMGNKLFIIKANENKKIEPELLSKYTVYLLKSNQQQDLGIHVLINSKGDISTFQGQYHVSPIDIEKKE